MSTFKTLFLLLLIGSPVYAQGAPQFSTGSMTQTVTTTQTIEEVSNVERFGASVVPGVATTSRLLRPVLLTLISKSKAWDSRLLMIPSHGS